MSGCFTVDQSQHLICGDILTINYRAEDQASKILITVTNRRSSLVSTDYLPPACCVINRLHINKDSCDLKTSHNMNNTSVMMQSTLWGHRWPRMFLILNLVWLEGILILHLMLRIVLLNSCTVWNQKTQLPPSEIEWIICVSSQDQRNMITVMGITWYLI